MRRGVLPLLLTALLAPTVALGQGWTARVDVGGTDARTLTREVGGTSLMLGIQRDAPTWLYLSAGIPLDSSSTPWGAVGAGARLLAAPLASGSGAPSFGMDVGAHGFGYRDEGLDGTGLGGTVEALPFASIRRGALGFELHAGGRGYGTTIGDTSLTRGVLDAGAAISYLPDNRLAIRADAKAIRSAEGSFPFAGAGVAYQTGAVSVWGSIGRYLHSELPDPDWSLGLSLLTIGDIRLEVAAQQDATDPLYWNPVRRFWSVGLSRALGSPSRPVALVAPIVPRRAGGGVVLELPAAEVDGVPAVGGDFNGWTAVPMRRVGDRWRAELDIPPGVYHYAFRAPDGHWFVPESVPNRVDDGFGGSNAVLVVTPTEGT